MYTNTRIETRNNNIMAGSYFFKYIDGFEAEVKADQPEGKNGKE